MRASPVAREVLAPACRKEIRKRNVTNPAHLNGAATRQKKNQLGT